jgi:sugar phosphate isomerase/epimerase
MEISAQLYTVRRQLTTEEEIVSGFTRIKKDGYYGVQLSGFKYEVPFMRDLLSKLNLKAVATHNSLNRLLEETDTIIKEHLELGCKYVGIGCVVTTTSEGANKYLSDILPVAKKIKDAGLQFVHHNHHYEFAKLDNGARFIDMLLDKTSPEDYGILADTYWLQVSGVSVDKFLTDNANRIKVIHLKDLAISPEDYTQKFACVGSGNMDFESIIETANKIGVEHAVVEQDECYGLNPYDCLAKSREYIKKLGW